MEQENMNTAPESVSAPEPTPAASAPSARKLYRDTEHAWVAGVCAGIAKHFSTDVVLVRLLTIAFGFLTGGGIVPLIYVIMAFVVPAEPLAAGKVSTERWWIVWFLVVCLLAPLFLSLLAVIVFVVAALTGGLVN